MTSPAPLVMIVEDEPAMSRLLDFVLVQAGYRVFPVETGREALLQASSRTPDAVLLDLGLPDMDGLEVVRRLRAWMRAPIVVVSARGREKDKVEALDAGADDYVTKPFGAAELLARLRVALRHATRSVTTNSTIFDVGGLYVDGEKRIARVRGQAIRLTPTEWKLLLVLVRNAGRVVQQKELLREVWGPVVEKQGLTHYLRVYVAELRRKIEEDPTRPHLLLTEPSVGYRLLDEV